MRRHGEMLASKIDRNLTASGRSSSRARAVPPPAQQVLSLQERLLEEAGLTPDKRIELAKRVLETIERGLEAVTVKGPRSVRVPDNMARMRAVELGIEILGLRAARRQRTGPAAVVVAFGDAPSKVPRISRASASRTRRRNPRAATRPEIAVTSTVFGATVESRSGLHRRPPSSTPTPASRSSRGRRHPRPQVA